jgi:hypothetical protein
MKEEEIEDYNNTLNLFAGIALPGIIGRASTFKTPKDIAREAFDLAEAMIAESDKRKKVCTPE